MCDVVTKEETPAQKRKTAHTFPVIRRGMKIPFLDVFSLFSPSQARKRNIYTSHLTDK
jgi:hypothetical protein